MGAADVAGGEEGCGGKVVVGVDLVKVATLSFVAVA
jgi:hypothetical protein